jgi:hypothetical protein
MTSHPSPSYRSIGERGVSSSQDPVVNVAVAAIAESVGSAAIYPFEPSGDVVDKLAFVHHQVAAHSDRQRSHAAR